MRILIAEDERISREIVRGIFSKYGECEVYENGKLAVEAFKKAWDEQRPFQLICLDIMMPELDGHGALEAIRNFERENELSPEDPKAAKVIMTTCLGDKENFLKAMHIGLEWYLTKPLDRNEIAQVLKDLSLCK